MARSTRRRGSQFNHKVNRRNRAAKLDLQVLEDRIAPAMVSWVGPSTGDWSTPHAWSNGGVPGVGDTAYIGPGNTVTFSVGDTGQVAGLDVDGTFDVAGGTLTVGSAAGSNFTVTSGGTISGAGGIEIENGASNTWSGGTMTGSGFATLSSGSSLTLSGSTDVLGGGWTLGGAGTATLTGELNAGSGGGTLNFSAMQWSSTGSVDLVGNTLTNAGTIELTGTSGDVELFSNNYYTGARSYDLGGTLINTGTIVQQGAGSLEMADNTILSNQGAYQFAADSDILFGNAAPNSFVNTATGTVKKTAGTGTSSIEVPFDNQGGAVDAETGTLNSTDGGTNTGGTYVANGTGVVDLTGGKSLTFTGTYVGSGTGRVQLASGTLAVGSGGATFDFPGGLFVFSGGTLTGTLNNASAGFMTLEGGTLSGTLNNQGSIVQPSGSLTISGSLSNVGTYDIALASSGTVATGTGVFTNTGTGILELSTNVTATLGSPFANQGGTVETTAGVTAGTLVLGGGGTSTGGSYDAASAGGVIDLAGANTSVFTGTYTGTGSGTVGLALGGAIAPGATGATLDFTAEQFLVSKGGFDVQGNTLTNAGNITLINAANVTVQLYANNKYSGGNTFDLGGTLINTGTIVQHGAGSLEMYDNTTLSNAGAYQFAADSAILYGSAAPNSFVNTATGTVQKTAGTGTSSIEVPFDNQGGTLDAESGTLNSTDGGTNTGGTYNANATGVVDLTGGKSPTFTGTYTGSGTGRVQLASGTFVGSGAVLNFPSGLFVFSGGTLGGTVTNAGTGFITDTGGMVSGTLNNQGTIVQPVGTLTISGDLSNAGIYDIALAASGTVTSGSGTFTNTTAGTLELTTDVTATLGGPFANQGGVVETTAASTAGVLVLGGGGTSTGGTYDATDGGAAIDVAGADSSVWSGSYSGSGAGAVDVSLGGAIAPGAAGATLNFTSELFRIAKGGLNLQGDTLTNTGTITLINPANVVVQLYANNKYSGGTTFDLGGTLINTGTIVQQGAGSLEMYDNTILSNQGTYQFAAAGDILLGSAAPNSFVNTATGVVKMTAGTGTASIEVPFDNQHGTVEAESGTLGLSGGGTSTGGSYIANGTGVIDLTGGSSPTLTGTYTGSGTGAIVVASGTLAIGTAGATFNFPSGLFSWTGGTFTGTLTNASTGFIAINGVTSSGTFDNLGTITQTGGALNVINSASFTVSTGTVNLSGGTGGTLTATTSTVNVVTGTFTGVDQLTGSGGAWNLTGTVTNNGTLAVAGTATGTITGNLIGGTLALSGYNTYLDTNGILNEVTLALSNDTSCLLEGGTISGGTETTAGGAELIGTALGGTLAGATLTGTLDMATTLLPVQDAGQVTVTDGLTLNSGSINFGESAVLTFQGSESLSGIGTVNFNNETGNNGIAVSSGGSLVIGGGILVQGNSGVVGSSAAGLLTNQGTIEATSGGTLTVQGYTNFSGGTLTGGAWGAIGGSTLRLVGANITTNAADVLLSGTASQIYSGSSGTTNALAGLATNTAGGSFTIENGANKTGGTFSNAGTIDVGSNSEFSTSVYTQTGGATDLQGGTLGSLPAEAINLQGGALSGNGTIKGELANSAEVDLGNSPGTLTIDGIYTQTATGLLNLKVGGTTAGSQYDQVVINGQASLDGALNVSLIDGFGPTVPETFAALSATGVTGSFATTNLPSVDGLTAFSVQTTTTSVNLKAIINSPDLSVAGSSIVVTGGIGTPGQNITVNYTVANLSPAAAIGSWTDSVYLSPDGTVNANDLLLGRLTHTGGLAGGSSYAGTLTAPLPGVADGTYYLIVSTDTQLSVPDINRTNNTGVSPPFPVQARAIPIATVVSGTIASGQDLYYEVDVPPGENVELAENFTVGHEAQIFANRFTIATPSSFGETDVTSSGQQPIVLPGTQGGLYYILVQGEQSAGSGESFTLEAQVAATQIQSFTSGPATTPGLTNINLVGAGFSPQTTVQLVAAPGTANAGEVYYPVANGTTVLGSSQVFATFDLTAVPPGQYVVEAVSYGQTVQAATLFYNYSTAQVVTPVVTLSAPPVVRVSGANEIGGGTSGGGGGGAGGSVVSFPTPTAIPVVVTISNPSLTTAAYSPTVTLLPTYTDKQGNNYTLPSVSVSLDAPSVGSALLANGDLPPGYSDSQSVVAAEVYGEPGGYVTVEVEMSTGPNAPIVATDYGSPPFSVSANAWTALIPNLLAVMGGTTMGTTVGQAESADEADVAYLTEQGETGVSQQQVDALQFEQAEDALPTPILTTSTDLSVPAPGLSLTLERTFNSTISGRYQLGAFGYGWSFLGDDSATTDPATGDVFIQQGGTSQEFDLVNGVYQSAPGDTSTLSLKDGSIVLGVETIQTTGSLVLRESDGTTETFDQTADNQWSFASLVDSNGNSILASYSGGKLTALTSSSGANMAFTYNSQGLIATATASTGQECTFNYDSGGHLLSVSGPDGSTSYSYITSNSNPAQENDLASITNTDGTHNYFTYDAQGRLVNEHGDPDPSNPAIFTGSVSIAYLAPAGYTVTIDATGTTATVLYNEAGEITSITDPLGNVYKYLYDDDGNVVTTILPDGSEVAYAYDPLGNATNAIDSLGSISATYNQSFSTLSSLTDENGNVTNYSTNSQGDLTQITDSPGVGNASTTQFVPNPTGEVQQVINANGQAIGYSYNSFGEVTQEDFGNGVTSNFTYDAYGELLTATDASGTTTFAYTDLAYPDQVTEVTEPNGMFIGYGYDANGRLDQMNENGYILNYAYDASGRLSSMTDSTGASIITYTYNAANQVIQEDMGNGTRTVYTYDADGNVLSITNYAPNHVIVNSFDVYTYDDLGNQQTDTNQDGKWVYSYDADSQLVGAVFTPNSTDPDGLTSQNLQYVYDAAGNRISETVNGVTTAYSTNNLNEYTSVGGAAYGYDADGNLTSIAGGATFTYNSQNELIALQTPTDTYTYTYDALGNLVASTHNGQATQFLVDPTGIGNVIGEYDGDGNLVANYTYGLGLTSQVSSGGTPSYYNFDATGNTVGLSGPSGNYVDSYSYLPFGEISTSSGSVPNPFQFVGQAGVMSTGDGLDMMRARLYSPADGRFIERDPIGVAGGTNLYLYAGNNPIAFVDPTGLQKLPGQPPGDNIPGYGNGVNKVNNPDQYENIGDDDYQKVFREAEQQIEQAAKPAATTTNILELIKAFFSNLFDVGPIVPTKQLKSWWTDSDAPTAAVPVVSSVTVTSARVSLVGDGDPNFISGPAGFGPQGYLPENATVPYTIGFENDASADAPAQVVEVTQQLDPSLDWSKFQLGDFGFGGETFTLPGGLTSYNTVINALNTVGVYVDVNADFDILTGLLTWTFTSLDPASLDIPLGNPEEGFLPPDGTPPEGEGWVSYLVPPEPDDATGTVINAQATVYFDAGLPFQSSLATASIFNTIDAGDPTSSVAALPVFSTASFAVNWTGTDDPEGSGIATYDVYVSDDDGPYVLWQSATTQTSAIYTAQFGHTYSFYSIATDNVGNLQPTPAAAQATTTVVNPVTITSIAAVSPSRRNTPVAGIDVTFSAPIGSTSLTSAALSLTDNGGANLITGSVPITLVSGLTYEIGGLWGLTAAEGTYTVTVNGSGIQDPYGNPGSGTISTSWLMDTTPPTSAVDPLPAQTTSTSFTVSVTGSDPGGSNGSPPSGIASYAIYDSEDNGPFTLFATATPADPSALFAGQAGHTYGFFSVATDNAGNVQSAPTAAQQTVQVLLPLAVSSITPVSPNPRDTDVTSIDVTFTEPIMTLSPGALTLTDDGGATLITGAVTLSLVSGDTYAIGGLMGLTAAEGEYTLTVNSADILEQDGVAGTNSVSTSWLMDTTAPSSHVVNSLGTSQATDTFHVSVSFSDPAGSGGAPASGVSSVQLWVSVNNGAFSLSQTMNIAPADSGTVTLSFTGQDRNVYAFHSIAIDAAGNTESKNSNTIEASTSVSNLNPPVTHILASTPTYSWGPFPSSEFSSLTPSSYANGVFTLNWAGADPDQNGGTPAGSIALVNIYVEIDTSTTPTLIGQLAGGTPNGSGVYGGSMTYDALADDQPHTYKFFSVGIDDQQKAQAMPGSPDVTFSEKYSAALAVTNLAVEKEIAERSFIEYLDVDFNQTASSSSYLQALANALGSTTATNKASYLELLWYGEGTPSASSPKGSVNLFGSGTTATVSFTGNDLSINFGANGITSLLTENGITGTGKPTSDFGDGWYALGIDTTGGNGPVFWVPFFRLFGSATGDTTVTGPYTTAGTDAYVVYNAEGQSGTLLNGDIDGNGAVNSKDLTYTVAAKGDTVGAGFVQGTSYPAFQLFAGSAIAVPVNAAVVTQSELQALLPTAIGAWQAADLDAADVRKLESVPVQVVNLGTTILGLEAGGVITINQTAAGYNWYVSAGSASSQAFGLVGPDGESLAGLGSPAANEVDLVTVLEHELGHVLGLPDNADGSDLMDITIGLGVRREPVGADVAALAPASNTAGVFNARIPLPRVAVPLSQSYPSNGPLTPSTVDAALASMLSAGAGNGDDHDPTANYGTSAQSTVHSSRLTPAPNGKTGRAQSALRHPQGVLLSRQSRVAQGSWSRSRCYTLHGAE